MFFIAGKHTERQPRPSQFGITGEIIHVRVQMIGKRQNVRRLQFKQVLLEKCVHLSSINGITLLKKPSESLVFKEPAITSCYRYVIAIAPTNGGSAVVWFNKCLKRPTIVVGVVENVADKPIPQHEKSGAK